MHAVCYGAYVISLLKWTAWSKAEGLVSVCVHGVSKHTKALRHKVKIRPRWSMKNSEQPFCIYLNGLMAWKTLWNPTGWNGWNPLKPWAVHSWRMRSKCFTIKFGTWESTPRRARCHARFQICIILNDIEWYWSRIWYFVMFCRYWLCIVWCIRWCSLCSHKFRGCLRGRDAQDLTDTCRHMDEWSWS